MNGLQLIETVIVIKYLQYIAPLKPKALLTQARGRFSSACRTD